LKVEAYSTSEMMSVAAARRLRDGAVCFVGIGLPSTAANLARLTHAPHIVLIYESGAIGAKPAVLPLSIGDGELATSADTVVSTPEIFRYYLQGGRIDVGFLGAAQIDCFANINTTVIGSYRKPQTRLPGAGGAPEIAALAGEVLIIIQHSTRSLVKQLDFVTSVGFLGGGDARERARLPGKGPVAVITDLCILEPDPTTRELLVASIHPGIERATIEAATGWPLRYCAHVRSTEPPSTGELRALRELLLRTAAAHGAAAEGSSSVA
jgi:glutaconate CoA-transferase subunit B